MTVRTCSTLSRIAVVSILFAGASLVVPAASAHESEVRPASVITAGDIDASIARQLDAETAQRQEVTRLLQHPEVQRIAGSAGIDLERAQSKAATLSGSELEDLAAKAAHAQAQLAGGDTIVISATAIIIVLLILILLTD